MLSMALKENYGIPQKYQVLKKNINYWIYLITKNGVYILKVCNLPYCQFHQVDLNSLGHLSALVVQEVPKTSIVKNTSFQILNDESSKVRPGTSLLCSLRPIIVTNVLHFL